jgi:hypothetical protein
MEEGRRGGGEEGGKRSEEGGHRTALSPPFASIHSPHAHTSPSTLLSSLIAPFILEEEWREKQRKR